jgi:hypothetical protein
MRRKVEYWQLVSDSVRILNLLFHEWVKIYQNEGNYMGYFKR